MKDPILSRRSVIQGLAAGSLVLGFRSSGPFGLAKLAAEDSATPDFEPDIFLKIHLPTMLLILFLFRGFIFRAVRRGSFQRWMGWPLVLIYAVYVIVQYAVS